MYLVFRDDSYGTEGIVTLPKKFVEAMNELLLRLAMAYALEKLRQLQEEAEERRAHEAQRRQVLEKQVNTLDLRMLSLEDAARGVRALLERPMGEYIDEWNTGVFQRLFRDSQISIRGCKEMKTRHSPNCDDPSWMECFAAGLLDFTGVPYSDVPLSHSTYWDVCLESNTADTEKIQ